MSIEQRNDLHVITVDRRTAWLGRPEARVGWDARRHHLEGSERSGCARGRAARPRIACRTPCSDRPRSEGWR
jgi:hypothetical protein